jgi:acyl-CoA reductase-like NAD-dependent aldehyde dehydrogenase
MSEIVMVNPATGEELGVKKTWSDKHILDAYEKAREKSQTFRKTTVEQRIEEIRKIKRYIVDHMESLVDGLSADLGKTKSEALLMEIFPVLDCIKYYEKNASSILADEKIKTPIALMGKKSYVFYEPLGTVLIIAPWNAPFTLSLIPIISAVLAGNTVIYKPSEIATYSGMLIEKVFKESDVEPDIVTFVYGKGSEIGDTLIEGKPDKIFFTGSTATGKIILEKAAKHLIPVELELGGKDPMIIFEDAYIERAVNAAVWGSLFNSGQVCVAVERIYVQESVYDKFVNRVVENVRNVKQGWDTKGEFDIGCLASEDQVNIVEDHINDAVRKGAKILTGGIRKGKTLFFEPTVIVNVDHSMKIMMEETFGPVVSIMKFTTEEEVVRLANDSLYGLNASVWTTDKEKALRVSRAIITGGVSVNNALMVQANFNLPYGGVKQSGYGRYHGPYGLHTFSNIKAVINEKGKKPKDINWYPFRADKYQRFLTTFQSLFSEKITAKLKGLPSMMRLMRSKE